MRSIYSRLEFPEPPPERPYVLIDMVTTIDGKTVSGEPGEDVLDLGSKLDHLVLRQLCELCDAILIGAGTWRATSPAWNPPTHLRAVASQSGRFPTGTGYESGGQLIVLRSSTAKFDLPTGAISIESGADELDLLGAFTHLRAKHNVKRLLCLGGSHLNGDLIRAGLADELFVTIAPKVKLGDGLPTYASGPPLPRDGLKEFTLIESHAAGDELFVRYRRAD